MLRPFLAIACLACAAPAPPPVEEPPPAPSLQGTPADPGPSPGDSELDRAVNLCLDETNRYRATIGLPALIRSVELEACAFQAAESDAKTHTTHGHFLSTRGCSGLSFAENELPWWSRSYPDGTLAGTIKQGLLQMWQEGKGGGHYENLTGRQYTEFGCGIVMNDDEVTVVQEFR